MSSARLRARDITLLAGLGSCVRRRICCPLSGDVKSLKSLASAVPGAEAEVRGGCWTLPCGDKNGGAGECACIAAWGVGGRGGAGCISAAAQNQVATPPEDDSRDQRRYPRTCTRTGRSLPASIKSGYRLIYLHVYYVPLKFLLAREELQYGAYRVCMGLLVG